MACVVAAMLVWGGCATLAPGADPLVVRAEQAETVAIATFNMVVQVDDKDREYWKRTVPGFHDFAEWLRAPLVVGTNTHPRGIAMIRNVEAIKQTYKENKAYSNVLVSVLGVLGATVEQAGTWLSVATNR